MTWKGFVQFAESFYWLLRFVLLSLPMHRQPLLKMANGGVDKFTFIPIGQMLVMLSNGIKKLDTASP